MFVLSPFLFSSILVIRFILNSSSSSSSWTFLTSSHSSFIIIIPCLHLFQKCRSKYVDNVNEKWIIELIVYSSERLHKPSRGEMVTAKDEKARAFASLLPMREYGKRRDLPMSSLHSMHNIPCFWLSSQTFASCYFSLTQLSFELVRWRTIRTSSFLFAHLKQNLYRGKFFHYTSISPSSVFPSLSLLNSYSICVLLNTSNEITKRWNGSRELKCVSISSSSHSIQTTVVDQWSNGSIHLFLFHR